MESAVNDFEYPLVIGEQHVTLTNSHAWIRELYEEAGRLRKSRDGDPAPSISDDSVAAWYTTKTKVVPGDVITLVDTLTYPTPKGMQTISRARIDQLFDRRYLLELEDAVTLKLYTYIELDRMRFAFAAMKDLVDAKVYGKDGKLSGLAKRDIKKNCSEKPSAEDEAVESPPSRGVQVQKFLRGVLEDECAARWPHTPISKSCVFKVEQDPKQPRHKPLFQATVELSLFGNRSFKGEWVSNKRDAESSAADVALRMLLTAKKK